MLTFQYLHFLHADSDSEASVVVTEQLKRKRRRKGWQKVPSTPMYSQTAGTAGTTYQRIYHKRGVDADHISKKGRTDTQSSMHPETKRSIQMMVLTQHQSLWDDVAELLLWAATGALTPDEQRIVVAALECAKELAKAWSGKSGTHHWHQRLLQI